MIRTAVLGRGLAGRIFHAPLIAAVPELQLASMGGREDAGPLIDSPDIDLIVVATPNDSHTHLASLALLAGKHVVIDKPFALDPDAGEQLLRLAARQGKMLTAFHNRRWDGDFLTVQELVKSKQLGTINLFESHWDRFRPLVPAGWRENPSPGAGTLWNLGPHMIDQMMLLFGLPSAVQADLVAQRPGALVDDYFSLTFHYGSMRAVISASNTIAAQRPRFAVHGSQGSFSKFGIDPQEDALASGTDPLSAGFGEEGEECHGTHVSGTATTKVPTQRGTYIEFYRRVVASILAKAPVPVTAQDAIRGLRIILSTRESAETGKLVTLINWSD